MKISRTRVLQSEVNAAQSRSANKSVGALIDTIFGTKDTMAAREQLGEHNLAVDCEFGGGYRRMRVLRSMGWVKTVSGTAVHESGASDAKRV